MACRIAALLTLCAGATAAASEPIRFDRDILPLLSDRCLLCHGPDEASREADLRLDNADAMFGATQNGGLERVVVPGAPDQSELIRRITTPDEHERMPPPESHLQLTDVEIEQLRQWIAAGATWETHWALRPIAAPPVPSVAGTRAPEGFLQNGVDAFVLQQMQQEDAALQPAAAADRASLIRRVSFDLTGLPPTPAEVQHFLQDRSPDAYQRLVDRLLASPRYGQRMAVPWLDAARYADTYGYQADVYRETWPWRDWVVQALNEGMPYDQFIRWQIAGDLVDQPSRESILATAFNRHHRQTNEGGSIEEEYRAEYAADRVNTLGTAVLGLTLECARCHDHKYDPISQRDYYRLFAYFNNIDESGLYSHFTDAVPTPTLMLPNEAQQQRIDAAAAAVADAEAALQTQRQRSAAALDGWLASTTPPETPIPDLLAGYSFDAVDKTAVAGHTADIPAGKLTGTAALGDGRQGQGLLLDGENGFSSAVGGDLTRDDGFTLAAWIKIDRHHERAVVWHRSRAWTDAGSRGFELLIEQGRLSAALVHFWPGNAIRIHDRNPLPLDQWVHVAVTYDGSSRARGLALYVDGQPAEVQVVRDCLTKTINGGGVNEIAVGSRFRDRGLIGGQFDELRIYGRPLTALEVAQLVDGRSLVATIAAAQQATTQTPAGAAARHAALEYFLAAVDPETRAAGERLRERRAEHSAAVDAVREVMVMRELPTRRTTHVLRRGQYDEPGDAVEPGVPSVVLGADSDAPANRLGLAQWLTDPRHPLVARVAVNRLWQSIFGQGLVATPEDFGRQGQAPTHPELLDYLAARLIAEGWDMKRLARQIVLSGTYRQSSVPAAEMLRRDPENRLLSRGPSGRLPVEMIRDAALLASGLLAEYEGGPPVKPYQPEGLWEEKNRSAVYKRDEGAGSHRRSLYTIWKRTSPPPSMLIFDAPDREVCVAQRRQTQTPLQALVLLNDEQWVEAARACAARVLTDTRAASGSSLPDEVLHSLCMHLIGRPPTDQETAVLQELFDAQRRWFAADPAGTAQFLGVGEFAAPPQLDPAELAATAVVAQTLMNFAPSVWKR